MVPESCWFNLAILFISSSVNVKSKMSKDYNLPGDEANTAGVGKGGDQETESLASTLHPAPVMDNYTSFFFH